MKNYYGLTRIFLNLNMSKHVLSEAVNIYTAKCRIIH